MSTAIGGFPAQAPLRRCEAMRKSRIAAAKTRERIVTAAAAEFRQHGIVATGLNDLMSAAGLTHGGVFKHLAAKDQIRGQLSGDGVETVLQNHASRARQMGAGA